MQKQPLCVGHLVNSAATVGSSLCCPMSSNTCLAAVWVVSEHIQKCQLYGWSLSTSKPVSSGNVLLFSTSVNK